MNPPRTDAEILSEFKARLHAMARDNAVTDFSPLIEPYIITHAQAGVTFKVIIFNRQSKDWYDNTNQDTTFPNFVKFDLVKAGQTVFDLGCSIGYNAVWLGLRIGPQGKLYAFDIFPWNTLATKYNAELNGLDNVYPITLGVGGSAYTRNIVAAESRIHQTVSLKLRRKTPIHVVPLDCFAGLKPEFIKCDIEGAEYEMLAGARQILAQHPTIMIEIHSTFIEQLHVDPLDVLRELNAYGYDVYLENPYDPERLFSAKTRTVGNMATYAIPRKERVAAPSRHYVDAGLHKLDFVTLVTKGIRARLKKAA